jgi:dihydrofolate reductase
MKTILYMAITANGMIAKLDGSTDFTSQEDWAGFKFWKLIN